MSLYSRKSPCPVERSKDSAFAKSKEPFGRGASSGERSLRRHGFGCLGPGVVPGRVGRTSGLVVGRGGASTGAGPPMILSMIFDAIRYN